MRYGAGIRPDGKWAVYMLQGGNDRLWTSHVVTDNPHKAAAVSKGLNEAAMEAFYNAPETPQEPLEIPEAPVVVHIPTRGVATVCGHPYPKRKGHPPKLCPDCQT